MSSVHLQPMVYTMRETSQPAPITAACTGYRVPEISSVAMKGVRFSVKLACARWAVYVVSSVSTVLKGQKTIGLTAVQLVRGGAVLCLLVRGVCVRVADALYPTHRGKCQQTLRLASAHGGAWGSTRWLGTARWRWSELLEVLQS